MFCSLVEVRTALERLAGHFDPAVLNAEQAEAAVDHAVAIKHIAATVEALAAARVAEMGQWRKSGERSAADWLARRSGTSRGQADDAVRTGKRLGRLDKASAAAKRGALSPAQATEIADAATAAPDAEAPLLELAAKGASLGELRDEARRRRAAADRDPEATHRRIHRNRYLRRYTDSEGAYNLHLRNTVAVGSRIDAALRPIIEKIFRQARAERREEPVEAYAADALAELAGRSLEPTGPDAAAANGNADAYGAADTNGAADANGAAETDEVDEAGGPDGPAVDNEVGGGSGALTPMPTLTPKPAAAPKPATTPIRHLALLRLDLEALRRGYAEGDEVVEIAGLGPIPVTTAIDMLGESVLKLVLTRGVDVVNVTHLGRGPTAAQKVALLWRNPRCTRLGCPHTKHIEIDHRTPWAAVQETSLGNLDGLCRRDHRLKTNEGWALVAGTGRRLMVPPDHPDHPANAPPDAGGSRRARADAGAGQPSLDLAFSGDGARPP